MATHQVPEDFDRMGAEEIEALFLRNPIYPEAAIPQPSFGLIAPSAACAAASRAIGTRKGEQET